MLIAHICPVLHSAVHAAPRAESYGGDDCMTDWKSTCVISQCMAHAAPLRQFYVFSRFIAPALSVDDAIAKTNMTIFLFEACVLLVPEHILHMQIFSTHKSY